MRRRRRPSPSPLINRFKSRLVLTVLIGLISGLAWILERQTSLEPAASTLHVERGDATHGRIAGGLLRTPIPPGLPSIDSLNLGPTWTVESVFADSGEPFLSAEFIAIAPRGELRTASATSSNRRRNGASDRSIIPASGSKRRERVLPASF